MQYYSITEQSYNIKYGYNSAKKIMSKAELVATEHGVPCEQKVPVLIKTFPQHITN